MFDLFNVPLKQQIGINNVTGWNQASNLLQSEFTKLRNYHRSNISFIPNNHPLVQLLATNIPSGLAGQVAVELSDKFDGKMTGLGIGSPFGRPDFSINSWFYNKKTYEILIQDSSLFDADEVLENWENAKPVRILHHPFNDISFAYPNGKYVSDAPAGFAVISINPAMLLLQYKGYLEHRRKTGREIQNTSIFVSQFPLFNALGDHLDIALRNRLISKFKGDPLYSYRSSYSIALNNPSLLVDAALSSVIKNIGTQSLKFNKVLEMIPAFTAATQRDVTPFPINAITHSTGWIYNVARAPILDFLMRYSKRYPNYENNDYINDISRSLKEMEMDRSVPNNASPLIRSLLTDLTHATSVV